VHQSAEGALYKYPKQKEVNNMEETKVARSSIEVVQGIADRIEKFKEDLVVDLRELPSIASGVVAKGSCCCCCCCGGSEKLARNVLAGSEVL
jgi:hypothetical protein